MIISNFISTFNKKLQFFELTKLTRRRTKSTAYVYRDDLSKTKTAPSQQPAVRKAKKKVRFAETEPEIIAIKGEETEKVVRITVKMTKEEARRMLSRCSNGGALEFEDVACELMRIPAARVSSAMAAV